jgi:tetraacyldisaccharide-1-P 4'-kinase
MKADFILTTEKDAARLHKKMFDSFLIGYPVYALEIQHSVIEGESKLDRMLRQAIA